MNVSAIPWLIHEEIAFKKDFLKLKGITFVAGGHVGFVTKIIQTVTQKHPSQVGWVNSLFSVFEIAIDLTKIYTLKLCKHVFSKFEISAWLLLSVCELLQAGANDPFSSCSKLQNTTGTRLGYFLWLLRLIKTGAKDIYLFTWRPWSKSRSCMECAATLVQDREKRRNRYSTPPPSLKKM